MIEIVQTYLIRVQKGWENITNLTYFGWFLSCTAVATLQGTIMLQIEKSLLRRRFLLEMMYCRYSYLENVK